MLRAMKFFRRSSESRCDVVLAVRESGLKPVPVDGALQTLDAPAPLWRLASPVWLHGLAAFAAAWLVSWILQLAVPEYDNRKARRRPIDCVSEAR